MHIFNLHDKPYLIINSKELLFREYEPNDQMQRISFTQIKKINIEHRYNAQGELFIWLSVHVENINIPYLIQVSHLNESLEEVFKILNNELDSKTKFKFVKSTKLSKLRRSHKGYKYLTMLSIALFFSLFLYHKLVLPSMEKVQIGSIQLSYQKPQGICSNNLKVAYEKENQKEVLVKNYCAIFGFWRLQDSKKIPLKYLQAEFGSSSAQDWILVSRKLVKKEKYTKAIISLEKAIYLDPDNKLSQVYLSQIYKLQGNQDKAMSLAKITVNKYKDFALAHENIAYLYQNKGNLNDAYTHFKILTHLSPKASIYIALAQIEEKKNLKEDALINYEKALVLHPAAGDILTKVGLIYWEKKNFSKAEEKLKKAYELESKNSVYFLNYYEISLVTKGIITPKQEEYFLKEHENTVEVMIIYDMLKIIKASINKKKFLQAQKKWRKKYQRLELDWSFTQMRGWLDTSSLDKEHIQTIQSTLGFFIGHQQAYIMRSENFKGLN
ncbi:MAG TPA: hypothetical protein EYO73_06510 [Sulfurimonas sp.]|nr:hypothetical protein [Sulfurimonas sp.]